MATRGRRWIEVSDLPELEGRACERGAWGDLRIGLVVMGWHRMCEFETNESRWKAVGPWYATRESKEDSDGVRGPEWNPTGDLRHAWAAALDLAHRYAEHQGKAIAISIDGITRGEFEVDLTGQRILRGYAVDPAMALCAAMLNVAPHVQRMDRDAVDRELQ